MPFVQRSFLLVKSGEVSVFTVTKGKALLTTTTGALPRPSWYTENLRGIPLSQGFSRLAYREQHFDCLACHVAAQHRAGIDIFVDGDTRLDDDVAGRAWVSYVTERVAGIGTPRVEVPPASFMADKGPGDLMWEVIETRLTPPVTSKIGETTLQLDRAYKAIAPMTDRPVKIGSISAQILALMLANEHYKNRLDLLMDLSIALNKEYHALADAGASRVVVAPDLPAALRPPGMEVVEDDDLDPDTLDAVGAALTTCAAACAETGTIALTGRDGQGRRALTLVPDLHVCLVRAPDIVETVPELIERLGPSARLGRPIVLLSGPSATSDIELARVEGVHGPRRLVVLVYEEG